MAKPFDATTKQIVEINPQDWLALLGLPRLPVELVDADLSAVTSDADRVLKVLAPPERLFHFEFESGRDARAVPQRAHRYNALLESLYDLPVATVVFLLNRKAGRLAEVDGRYERSHPDLGGYLNFRYRVVRVWELPLAEILAGGVATLPLAVLTDYGGMRPERVVAAIHERIVAEAEEESAAETLISSAYLLAGLRFRDTIVQSLFKGVLNMEESSTYQAILQRGVAQGVTQGLSQGRVEEARSTVLRLGRKRFGLPSASVVEALSAWTSLERLERLQERVFEVESWSELLADN